MPINLCSKKKKVWNHKKVGKVYSKVNHTEEETRRSLEHANIFHERIFDLKDYVARRCDKCYAPITTCSHCGHHFPTLGMVPPRQWADFRAIVNGVHVLIECKETNWKGKFPTKNVKKEQLEALSANVLAGGASYLFICNRSREPMLNLISIQDYMAISVDDKGDQLFQISMDRLDKYSIVMKRLPHKGKPYYDLTPWTLSISKGID